MTRKTKSDVEKLVSQTQSEIGNLDAAIERLALTLRGIEGKISSATVQRNELEQFSVQAPTWLSTGEITLEQFANNGLLIDAVTSEIDRFNDLHDATSELMANHTERRNGLQTKLQNLREMLMALTAESISEAIIKKSGAELKKLLAVLGRHADQPSGAIAGSLLESTLFGGGQMPRAEKAKILKEIG